MSGDVRQIQAEKIMDKPIGYVVDFDKLPEKFPTHRHNTSFWESLGRTVATFGFLEETLTKAIFSFTATKPYSENEVHQAYEKWRPKLEKALTDQLGNLIETYGKAVREHPGSKIENFNEFLALLKKASKIRNVICHGSWRPPDSYGASIPFFVNRTLEVFETPVDTEFLEQVQRHTAELACAVYNTVTCMGWQFPGSNGPGEPIW